MGFIPKNVVSRKLVSAYSYIKWRVPWFQKIRISMGRQRRPELKTIRQIKFPCNWDRPTKLAHENHPILLLVLILLLLLFLPCCAWCCSSYCSCSCFCCCSPAAASSPAAAAPPAAALLLLGLRLLLLIILGCLKHGIRTKSQTRSKPSNRRPRWAWPQ